MVKKIAVRTMAAVMTFLMVFTAVPLYGLAKQDKDSDTDCSEIVGTYRYKSDEGVTVIREDTFAYNDVWFSGSSFDFNRHLATLSALMSEASNSVFTDELERDHSRNSVNIEAIFKDMQFEDVAVNTYYNIEKMPDSASVAVAHKHLSFDGEDYTLIAIVPMSEGYKQEWAGNFQIGKDGIHEGFKAGRDEILRFTKKYISDHNISGKVKIWTCGHSRGSALANLVAGFFATEGATDYISGISVDKEDVYSYCFAVPSNIAAANTTVGQTLNVAGSHSLPDPRYASDTEGAEFIYTGANAGDAVNPSGADYAGIHYVLFNPDFITKMPPQAFGLTRYGVEESITDGRAETREAMLRELYNLDNEAHYIYNGYIDGGDPEDFHWKDFDVDSLSFVNDDDYGTITQGQFYDQRLEAFCTKAGSREVYVDYGYQEILSAFFGMYGMNDTTFASVGAFTVNQKNTLYALVFTYLAYAAERLVIEERASTDDEAVALVVEELIEYITKESIDPDNYTVDDLFLTVARYLLGGATATFSDDTIPGLGCKKVTAIEFESEAARRAFNAISGYMVSNIPATYAVFIEMFIPGWSLMDDAAKKEAAGLFVYGVLNGCVYGDGDSTSPGTEEKAKSIRGMMYGAAGLLFSSYPAVTDAIADNGSHNAKELLMAVSPILRGGDDVTLVQAADNYLTKVFRDASDYALNSGAYDPGSDYYNDVVRYSDTIIADMDQFRMFLSYLLFYSKDEAFSVNRCIHNAATLVAQASKINYAHYNEVYLAWMRAQDSAYPAHLHALSKVDAVEPTCTTAGNTEYWECGACGLIFADAEAKQVIEKEDTVVKKLGHDWGEYVVTKEPTTEEPGIKTSTCNRCGETRTKKIPKLDPEEVSYLVYSGDNSSWKKKSGLELEFVFKRSVDDQTTFDHFKKIKVDGKWVASDQFTADSGSLIIKLHADYLETLTVGQHTIEAVFNDGKANAVFNINDADDDKPGGDDTPAQDPAGDNTGKTAGGAAIRSPKTGENVYPGFVIILLMTGVMAGVYAGAGKAYGKKRKK